MSNQYYQEPIQYIIDTILRQKAGVIQVIARTNHDTIITRDDENKIKEILERTSREINTILFK